MKATGTSAYKARTRSSRAQNQPTGNDEEPIQTPDVSKTLKKTPVKKNRFKDRKYFNVEQDWKILSYWRDNQGKVSTREIADTLAEEIDHSSESVRDRIKRYISKMKVADQDLLEKEAKKNPKYHAHFVHDKSRNKKVITHFSAQQPKIAGSTLTLKEKRAIRKKLAEKKKRISGKGTPKKMKKAPTPSKEELIKIKEKADEYKTKLRKRAPPKPYVDPYAELNKILRQSFKRRKARILTEKTKPKRSKKLQKKVGLFLEQLGSTEEQDVECNAEILAEIIKSFAVTFSLDVSDIVGIIAKTKGKLNMESIRSELFKKIESA